MAFDWDGATWSQVGIALPGYDTKTAGLSYGGQTKNPILSGDGKTLIWGQERTDVDGTDTGIVSVYQEVDSNWQLVEGLPLIGAENSQAGTISMSRNGRVFAVGARGANQNGVNSGRIDIYQLTTFSESNDTDGDGVNDEDDVYPLDATLWSMKIEDALAGIDDDNLRACVAEATSGKQQVSEVTELNCARRQVSALNGLSGLTNLTTLVLHDNQVTDVSELSGLINLTFLNLGNNLTDISGLSGLTNLTWLRLGNNADHGYFGVIWVNKSDLVGPPG